MHVLLIGLGNMGSKYLAKLQEFGIVPVLCDLDPSKTDLCEVCPFYCHFGDVREEVSRVIVAVNPEDHVGVASEFLSKSIPVLLEKPPASTSEEFRKIWDSPFLEISEIELYSHPVKNFPRGLRPRRIHIQRLNRGRGYINPLWDLAWHDLYILQYLFGELELSDAGSGDIWYLRGTAGGIPFYLETAWEYKGEVTRKWTIELGDGSFAVMDFLNETLEIGGRLTGRKEGDKLMEMVSDFIEGRRREGSSARALRNLELLESLF
jgi:predicted dehydrogenase